jgi:hypothetical protein
MRSVANRLVRLTVPVAGLALAGSSWGDAARHSTTVMALANPIASENALPGTSDTACDISVNTGQTIDFKILTDSANFRIDIYRLRYYGGAGARNVASLGTFTHPQNQAVACSIDAAKGLVDCGNWAVFASWTATGAVAGIYVAKPTRIETGGANQTGTTSRRLRRRRLNETGRRRSHAVGLKGRNSGHFSLRGDELSRSSMPNPTLQFPSRAASVPAGRRLGRRSDIDCDLGLTRSPTFESFSGAHRASKLHPYSLCHSSRRVCRGWSLSVSRWFPARRSPPRVRLNSGTSRATRNPEVLKGGSRVDTPPAALLVEAVVRQPRVRRLLASSADSSRPRETFVRSPVLRASSEAGGNPDRGESLSAAGHHHGASRTATEKLRRTQHSPTAAVTGHLGHRCRRQLGVAPCDRVDFPGTHDVDGGA